MARMLARHSQSTVLWVGGSNASIADHTALRYISCRAMKQISHHHRNYGSTVTPSRVEQNLPVANTKYLILLNCCASKYLLLVRTLVYANRFESFQTEHRMFQKYHSSTSFRVRSTKLTTSGAANSAENELRVWPSRKMYGPETETRMTIVS